MALVELIPNMEDMMTGCVYLIQRREKSVQIKKQLETDLQYGARGKKEISLLAKWLPSCNARVPVRQSFMLRIFVRCLALKKVSIERLLQR